MPTSISVSTSSSVSTSVCLPLYWYLHLHLPLCLHIYTSFPASSFYLCISVSTFIFHTYIYKHRSLPVAFWSRSLRIITVSSTIISWISRKLLIESGTRGFGRWWEIKIRSGVSFELSECPQKSGGGDGGCSLGWHFLSGTGQHFPRKHTLETLRGHHTSIGKKPMAVCALQTCWRAATVSCKTSQTNWRTSGSLCPPLIRSLWRQVSPSQPTGRSSCFGNGWWKDRWWWVVVILCHRFQSFWEFIGYRNVKYFVGTHINLCCMWIVSTFGETYNSLGWPASRAVVVCSLHPSARCYQCYHPQTLLLLRTDSR